MRFGIAACAAAVAITAGVALAGGGGKIKWGTGKEHDSTVAKAKVSGIPVMLYFTADW